jgi:ribosomal silencing factor RsfS
MEDVFILCHRKNAQAIADAFAEEFRDSQVKATVLTHGNTAKWLHPAMGFVVVEWEESAPREFLHQLDINQDITDYAVYGVPSYYESWSS